MRTHDHDDRIPSPSSDGVPADRHEPRMQHHHGRPRIMPGHPLARGFRPGDGPGFPGFPGFPGMGGFGGPGFGPGRGRGGRGRARRGDVRLAILSLLADAPSNGYGLITGIAAKTEGAWRPSPGSVYPTLQQLVDEDLIVADETGAKSVYSLTDQGRAHVEENQAEIDAAWAATTDKSEGEDAFQTSLMKLMGVVKPLMHDATDAQRQAAAAKLDETRRALYAILAD
ncbi:DNA-binding PadR family transcriptional regulator [Clavibacter michiganensis]|uniref:PadR family transcriptional regulator n=1 Tax=Clavibacter michiganensis TaxID=28447 RepID=UPI001AEB5CF9|nr:PadR family transcriptional regulator [Clavibacter michiganensis]MBP2459009.1 DNA-binding PadR family transcriptional regulator [Clavibacter michiganensis]MDQ0411581.1 DNA-binding PadR family transcriptional regulator [Clavibacter michiganensis]